MVNDDLCENVVEIRMVSDRMVPVVLAYKNNVLRMIHGQALQSEQNLENTVFL